MSSNPQLESTLALALQLPTRDRLRLVERVLASVNAEMDTPPSPPTPTEHWGQKVIALLESLPLGDWDDLDPDDVTDWVRDQRRRSSEDHFADWQENE